MIKKPIIKSKSVSVLLQISLIVVVLLVVSLLFYLYEHGAWQKIVEYHKFFINSAWLRDFILSFGPFSHMMFILIQALQVVFAPIPGEVTGFVGGYLFGNGLGTVLSTIGLLIGSSFAFAIARAFGEKFVEKVVKKKYVDKFDFFITHKGLYLTFILFIIPGFPKDSLCYLLGLTRLRFVDFFLMNLIGRLPGTLMLTYQGSAIRNEQYFSFFTLFIISILLILVLYFLREYVIRKFGSIARSIYGYFKKSRESR